ncbi:site-specific DNA-methyltransferase [Microbacterium jejuense]|uniref:Methyltransferase n=1 Tax=Microbacterium jejuense TaxID=1263637 RepID=A0ABS7HL15_9MICO|nr:site-specific DNA-methyltransferase [Microbacterium jejuense]MBW9093135.1 site-specific DNA-methyltransferase [Microbacterium jejuense]
MTVVYQDEWVTLHHADYRDALGELRADAVITDPPYGETSLAWDRWADGWLSDAARVTDTLWCWGSFRMFHDHAAEFAADWKLAQDRVWEKHNGSSLANDRFRRVHELATHWYRGDWADIRHEVPTTPDATPRAVKRRATKGEHQGARGASSYVTEVGGPRLMRSVQFARSEHGRAIHPTQKPLAVVTPLIEYSVAPGGVVVDLFAGSASVAVAARQAGRRCVAFEVRADYAERAAQRLASELVFEEAAS